MHSAAASAQDPRRHWDIANDPFPFSAVGDGPAPADMNRERVAVALERVIHLRNTPSDRLAPLMPDIHEHVVELRLNAGQAIHRLQGLDQLVRSLAVTMLCDLASFQDLSEASRQSVDRRIREYARLISRLLRAIDLILSNRLDESRATHVIDSTRYYILAFFARASAFNGDDPEAWTNT